LGLAHGLLQCLENGAIGVPPPLGRGGYGIPRSEPSSQPLGRRALWEASYKNPLWQLQVILTDTSLPRLERGSHSRSHLPTKPGIDAPAKWTKLFKSHVADSEKLHACCPPGSFDHFGRTWVLHQARLQSGHTSKTRGGGACTIHCFRCMYTVNISIWGHLPGGKGYGDVTWS
jgi:hypothetical protein